MAEKTPAQLEEAVLTARAEADGATASKRALLAHVSRAVRTPLTAMLGFAELLATPGLAEEERVNYAHIIKRNGELLLALVNDLADLSQLEAGSLTLDPKPSNLPKLLEEVAGVMAARAAQKGLAFSVTLAGPIPVTITSDAARLQQVLLNLVGNAVKFTARGTVELRVSAADAVLEFEVVDSGPGMSAQQVSGLFRPFAQLGLELGQGASGLGLAITRALVEALGGRLAVRSTPGLGSTFSVQLTGVASAGVELVSTLHAPASSPSPVPAAGDERLAGAVLLAEDNPDNQALFRQLLEKVGVRPTLVETGKAALEEALAAEARGAPYALVLMDMQMPELDGYEATRRLRDAGYRRPVVALTAYAMLGERERCLEAGCDAYLAKPVKWRAFLQVLRRYLPPAAPAAR